MSSIPKIPPRPSSLRASKDLFRRHILVGNVEVQIKLLRIVFDFFESGNEALTMVSLENLAQDNNLIFKQVKESFQDISRAFNKYLQDDFSETQIIDALIEVFSLDPDVAKQWIVEFRTFRNLELHSIGTPEILLGNKIVDFQWKYGVCLSSDEMESIGAPMVQLRFGVEHDNRVLYHAVELNIEQFYDLLAQLKMAQSQMKNSLPF